MDLRSLNTIAPGALIQPADSLNGVYITYSYPLGTGSKGTSGGGMRFRLNQVHTKEHDVKGFPARPMLSAVFFD